MRKGTVSGLIGATAGLLTLAATCGPPKDSFVNWENAPVHGLEMTPDRARLLAVNTADDRVEVFDITTTTAPVRMVSIPVGLDPVSVRARTNTEVWVVNHISDSVSVVDLTTSNVVATLRTGDEPTDVVFAGNPQRAFVVLSHENRIQVYDPFDLTSPPLSVPIQGEDPRALATDGSRVYAAIFESGNRTSFIPASVVSDPSGPYGGQNPPPNAGASFQPSMTAGLPQPFPHETLIVRKSLAGRWLDVNGTDWTSYMTWDLHDHDVAVIDASTMQVGYVSGLMNLDMSLAVGPDGRVAVVGTDATNEVRFEPNLRSTFVRVKMATFPAGGGPATVVDLNPHLSYATPSIPASARTQSLADPRSVVWSSSGDRIYVSGMGSNSVIVTTPNGTRLGRVGVGAGPTGLVLDEPRKRLYVLNRFAASISVVDTATLLPSGLTTFYDPTPEVIKSGRPFLYEGTRSGLGQAPCGSCHVDARMDQLAWDLGNPAGQMKPFDATCAADVIGLCEDWHPMKGPLLTQSLISIIGTEPFHWRGDREDLAAFAPAFVSLQGFDSQPSGAEMQRFEDFLATTRFPPNPYRNLDNSLRTEPIWNGGIPSNGYHLFNFEPRIVQGFFTCTHCHSGPLGSSEETLPRVGPPSPTFKVAPLRNVYERDGFSKASLNNNRGFGPTADGSQGDISQGLLDLGFTFPPGEQGLQERHDIEAFLVSFGDETHAAVGQQVTLNGSNKNDPAVLARLETLIDTVDGAPTEIGLVFKGRNEGVSRGAYYVGNDTFQTDLAAETIGLVALLDLVAPGSEMTATVAPYKSRIRIGVDRDEDGKFDRDEVLAGTDPANPGS